MLSRRAVTALAFVPVMPIGAAAATPADNPEIIRLLAEIVAQVGAWEVGLDEVVGLPGEHDPEAEELSRRIDAVCSLLQRLVAIPACTAGDMARKVLAFRAVEADAWDDAAQSVVGEISLKALLADAERLTGEHVA